MAIDKLRTILFESKGLSIQMQALECILIERFCPSHDGSRVAIHVWKGLALKTRNAMTLCYVL
jgi:hypothetical protein